MVSSVGKKLISVSCYQGVTMRTRRLPIIAYCLLALGYWLFSSGCSAPVSEIIYVSCTPDKVMVIDMLQGRFLKTIQVGSLPRGIAFLPDGKLAFVANSGADTVSVIDTGTRKVTKTIKVGHTPNHIAVTPGAEVVLVSCSGDGTLSVIDVKILEKILSIRVGREPMGIALSKDGYTAYVADSGSGTLSIVSTVTFKKEGQVEIGGKPMDVAVLPDGRLVVADAEGEVLFLEGEPLQVTKRLRHENAWGVVVK